jgi:hypothetical protein
MADLRLHMLGSHPSIGRYSLEAPFRRTDAGRAGSKRPRQRNDCTVRALASAASVPYDEAYDALAAGGRKAGRGFDFRGWAKTGACDRWRLVWTACPAVKGQMRVTPVTFALAHPEGRYVLCTAKHVLAVVDGVVIDDGVEHGELGLAFRCVYGAWRLTR